MTPEERDLIVGLFDRLAQLERNPRDTDAERAIREGLQRAPNAIYALVQSVLVQDEALRAANDHIADLEDELSRGAPGGQSGRDERPRSFLEGVRDTVFGRDEQPRGGGSVPSVGRDRPMGAPPGYGERHDNPWGNARDAGPGYGAGGAGGPGYGGPGGPGGPAPGGGGGGFLGTAAAVAAGAIGGSLLMGGIRSALGSQGAQSGALGGAMDHLTRGGGAGGGRVDPNSSLAQDAGLGDVGRGGRTNMAEADRRQDADQDQDDQQDEDDAQDEEQDGDFDDADFESDDDDN